MLRVRASPGGGALGLPACLKWVKVGDGKTDTKGRYEIKVSSSKAGTWTLRAVGGASDGNVEGTSKSTTVKIG